MHGVTQLLSETGSTGVAIVALGGVALALAFLTLMAAQNGRAWLAAQMAGLALSMGAMLAGLAGYQLTFMRVRLSVDNVPPSLRAQLWASGVTEARSHLTLVLPLAAAAVLVAAVALLLMRARLVSDPKRSGFFWLAVAANAAAALMWAGAATTWWSTPLLPPARSVAEAPARPDPVPDVLDAGQLDKAGITAHMRTQMDVMHACYEAELEKHPGLAGRIGVRFSIQPSGHTSDVVVEENTLKNAATTGCVVDVIRSLEFPQRPTEEMYVSFPFDFSPAR